MREHYRLKVERDDDATSPVEEDFNLGTMYCWHRRYNLGHYEKHRGEPDVEMLKLIAEFNPDFEETLDVEGTLSEGQRNKTIWEELEKHYVVMPLYLLDHSGISISTGSFNDPWDSGQVGFIFCSLKKAEETLGYDEFKVEPGVWTKEKRERIEKSLKIEVEVYDQFLTGDVYGFVLEKLTYEFEHPDEDVDVKDDDLPWDAAGDSDSCWGFFGTETNNGMLDHIGNEREAALKDAFNNIGEWVECPAEKVEPASA